MEFYKWVKIEIYVPEDKLQDIRNALNKGGAGKIGDYDNCLSMYEVRGYWRPLEGADPFEGEVGKVCEGRELKIEARCYIDNVKTTIDEILKVHPYEEPVINIIPLINHVYIDDNMKRNS
ncbi:cytochrome C biogenesis protein [Oceanirhabdus sp. W0125-5]|uniref:cytochrome C biogenesis protein n=1 Tax=Oceanirhabdus sp. W0125-5 TaxID=2999116 RepID=UPI0022F2ABDD|nr:cytochrome C biogenesis protein [Oceanirhabdus sp. W0125-5]WBW97343.1 cytochrome C biogenesis protein [Oceanirhabdus sp. W0125-5]